jgi:thioredoxin-dependent peroxiredoxin
VALIEVGKPAPAFSLTNQDGKPVTLKQHAGKYVLLWWYPKADTPGWTTEGNGFRDRIQQFKSKDVVILGVSFDAPKDNAAFRQKFGFPYDLCSDQDKTASIAYGAAEPDSPRPRRVSVLIGPDGKVAVAYDKVTPADHPDQVLADLSRLE